eukprot:TRINITY_DN18649_c0_g1_i1.p2 TRINITY_DN18649_c0_g1~~TRINITY_DN18649_c0_g1_i1.p2  ORF type:complete len:179 (-),score=7.32 TRINITY_DN18649_c0_g1_i1:492-962(-)
MDTVKGLIDHELSEPYSVFTYRYFLTPWPQLCFFAYIDEEPVGVVVCKIDKHKSGRRRGYIGMIVVLAQHRKLGIGSQLVQRGIQAMLKETVDEVVLECEVSNKAALRLYEKLGFIRDKRLRRYYLTGSDAIRLKLRIRSPEQTETEQHESSADSN